MINLYSGTPGSGKSLHSACTIYWRLKRGLPVLANFEINTTYFKKNDGQFVFIDNTQLVPSRLIRFSNEYFKKHRFGEDKILLVIDECQLLFNSRDWDMEGRREWLSFFTQHRKYGYEIILVAQFDRMLDRQIRSLIEYEYVHRKVSNFGFFGKIMSLFSLGKLFVAVKIWYPLKEKVGSDFFKAKKRYYRLYDSYNHFEDGQTAEAPAEASLEPKKKPEKLSAPA